MRKRDLQREQRQRMQIGAGLLLAILTLMGTLSFIKNPSVTTGVAPTELVTAEDFSVK